MTWLIRQSSGRRVLLAVALAAGIVGGMAARFSLGADAREAPRVIVLVARGMAFQLEGGSEQNPTLRVKAGERLRVVLRNEDTGLTHDFAVPEWKIATRALAGKGTDEIVLTVPGRPGTSTYLCNPHAAMMYGTVVIE